MSATDYIILAGGCFWGMEQLFSELEGVTETSVGYTGGDFDDPGYKDVSSGGTGHAEAVKITFDTETTNLKEILHFFFRIHDPTTENRQGNDVGTQYRSAIFVRSDEQRELAKEVIQEVNDLGRFPEKVVTQIDAEKPYYLAEDYHQNYLGKNPGGYTCHFVRE